MKSYLTFEPGVPELEEFAPHCWVHVECPDEDDFMFLTKELGIPREFLSDIADIDERPRAEREDDWLLTILRIPMDGGGPGMPYQTVPLGIITGHRATVSVCYRRTQLLPDFLNHIRRGNEAMLGRLRTTSRASSVDPDLFEDVSIELRQAYNTINIYTDIVTSMMDASANIISNNVNTIMKRMTSISIVLTVPTMISSFFGMNVNVYLGEWYWAFLAIFGVSVAISGLAFYLFRKIKWF